MSPVASGLLIGAVALAATLVIGGIAVVGVFLVVVAGLNNQASNK
jgi:hypothetical protein